MFSNLDSNPLSLLFPLLGAVLGGFISFKALSAVIRGELKTGPRGGYKTLYGMEAIVHGLFLLAVGLFFLIAGILAVVTFCRQG
jgi:hypothetical protein